jgi:hypothetical protein
MSMIHQMVSLTKEQLDELLTRPETVEDFIERQSERTDECSLYKSWHLMHFLLNGDPWRGEIPLGWAVFGGEQLGTVDVGYGPARYLLPKEVQTLVSELRLLPTDELFDAYDPAAMRAAKLYCAPDESQDASKCESLREYYERMVRFYGGVAEAGFGVLTWLH